MDENPIPNNQPQLANAANANTGHVAVARSEEFFKSDGNLFLQVENVMFSIHRSFLLLESEVFQGMFAAEIGGEDEGDTEDKPIILPDITAKEFSNLLQPIYNALRTKPFEVDQLIDVLKLSTMYIMPNLRHWAIYNLSRLPFGTISVAYKLKLSIDFEIKDWLDGAFCSMALRHFDDISTSDIRLIGMDLLIILIRLKSQIEKQTRILAFTPPPCIAHATECIANSEVHKVCKKAWTSAWMTKIAQNLLHHEPLLAFSSGELLTAIEKLNPERGRRECIEKSIQETIESGAHRVSLELVTSALAEVKERFGYHAWATHDAAINA